MKEEWALLMDLLESSKLLLQQLYVTRCFDNSLVLPKQPENNILDYQSQQHKLMPMLAFAYAFLFEGFYLVNKDSEMKDEQVIADVLALPAGLKAYATSYTKKSLSVCRKSYGGQGYAAVKRFGDLYNDQDIFQTF